MTVEIQRLGLELRCDASQCPAVCSERHDSADPVTNSNDRAAVEAADASGVIAVDQEERKGTRGTRGSSCFAGDGHRRMVREVAPSSLLLSFQNILRSFRPEI